MVEKPSSNPSAESRRPLESTRIVSQSTALPASPADPEPPVELAAGLLVGRYEITGVLGRGGMGVVYRAHDPALDRSVAIKLLRAGRSRSDAAAQQRLIREAQSIAQLAHPNVVEVYEIGRHQGDVYIAMELVDGESLRGWMEPRGRGVEQALAILRQAGQGLAAAHRAGIVHRDFKPDNVMVSHDGRVRVLDFGLAQAGEPSDMSGSFGGQTLAADHLTQTGTAMGTPAYMAPEQFVAEAVDARTDQFAFCVVVIEALSGRRPFVGHKLEELARRTIGHEIDPAAWRGVPRRMVKVLRRGLAPRREDRWPDMDALLAALGDRRTRGVALGVAGSAIVVAALGVVVAAPDRCFDDGRVRAELWDDVQHERVSQAILSTNTAHADATWTRVRDQLDDRVDALAVAHTAACRAGEPEATRMLTCLGQRQVEFTAAIDALASTDRVTVHNAERVSASLPGLELCRPDSRGESPAAASSPALAAARARLASAMALGALGRYRAALAELDAAPAFEESEDRDGVAAQMAQLRGALSRDEGNGIAAAQAFERAYFAALLVGRDDLAIVAAAELAAEGAVGYRDRWQWAAHAKAELARAGGGDSEVAYDRAMCTLQRDSGAIDLALEHCAAALAAAQRDAATTDDNIAALRAYADARTAADESVLARDLYAEALVISERTWGTQHPKVADALDDLGHAELALGHRAEARRLGERALASRQSQGDVDDVRVAHTWSLLASIDFKEGAYDQAHDGFSAALALQRQRLGDSHPEVAASWHALALTQEKRGERPTALASMARAAAIEEQLHPLDIARLPTLRELARMAYEFGAGPSAGREHLERAWEIVGQSGVPLTHPLVKDLDHGYGETLLALGESAAALPYLERFVGDPRPSPVLPHLQFVLGRALWKAEHDRERAVELVRTAARAWAEPANDFQRDQVAAMGKWLAASSPVRQDWDEGMNKPSDAPPPP